ncbi:MAG: sulfite oxidase-like oxidoreductase [Bauldia sp.]|nr:sulfite oxidase-like oxidoreductase [Bauldia sp.]
MDQPPISRGFRARRPVDDRSGRIPPGQHLVTDFPVLSAGPTPHTDLAAWTFTLSYAGTPLAAWRWPEFEALTQTELTCHIHCVTTWSKLDTRWRGVTFDTLFEAAGLREPPGPFAMFHCDGGYTTNVPVTDLVGGKAMIATRYDGAPLPAPHGGPARGLVPHLYFWKSAKWVRGVTFMDRDQPGFWEQLGYNMYGDPWREQRYTGD